jgi:hypothetical protein
MKGYSLPKAKLARHPSELLGMNNFIWQSRQRDRSVDGEKNLTHAPAVTLTYGLEMPSTIKARTALGGAHC